MRFSVYQVSRKGGREKNEDRMGYCYTRDSGLFALADGMGGHPEGEVASQLALQTLAALFQRDAKPTLKDPLRFLNDAVIAGHHQLLRYATERALIDTPRTTVVAAVLQGNAAYWAHCGDSRLYLVRGDKLIARTRDHSYSELQETLSQVVPIGERFNRNVLFTCLGSPGKPVVDTVGPLLMQSGDRILLCSDGLWGTVDDNVITEQLARRDISDAVSTQLHQVDYLHGSRRWGLATQYQRVSKANSLHDAVIGELSWYFRNDVGNSNLHWIKINVERQVERAQTRADTIVALQYYRYW